jgi:hypothetical protein
VSEVPEAVIENVALFPVNTVVPEGCTLMELLLLTVTVAPVELAEGQTPFFTTARYNRVAVRLLKLRVEFELVMSE